ncbi:MAG: hypothetical protein WBS24_15630 [Terriglobales bacterium]
MPQDYSQQLWTALNEWWREHSQAKGARAAASLLAKELWGFLRDSTPERRRSRYGDMDYDWEQRVDTTSGTVAWRERLLGLFHSPYQPTDPALFREMMAALPIDFHEFTFIDIGSGKGRTLLMASEFGFKKIIGVELMEELHRAAEKNIAAYRDKQLHSNRALDATPRRGFLPQQSIEALCMDAREFVFPEVPLVVYLFNPLPEAGLRRVLHNLEDSWKKMPRPLWIVYHNPLLEAALSESPFLEKAGSSPSYSLYRTKAAQD